MAYNTGNASGSTHPKDLIDNAEDLDLLLTGAGASNPNRLGVSLKSWKGMEAEHDADQARRESEFDASQAERVVEFNEFLDSSGYETPVDYASGISIVRTTQIVRYLSELYRPKDSAIPFVTTTFAADEAKWISNGDNSLRQELANSADPAKGAAKSGRGVQIVNSVAELRALLKSSPSKNAFVSGYSAAGDGGGPGWVYLDALDTTSPDNGQTLFVAADGGRWKQVNNNYPALPNTSTAYNITNMGFRLKFAAANILKNSSFYVWHDTGIAPMGTNLAENTNRMVCAQWRMETVGAGTTISAIQRVTAVEGGLRFTVAFGPSLGYAYVRQNVLGVRQFSGKTLTATVDIEVSAACQLDFYARLRFNALNDEANRPLVVGTSLISLAAGRHTVAIRFFQLSVIRRRSG